jgi:hypothetical protein
LNSYVENITHKWYPHLKNPKTCRIYVGTTSKKAATNTSNLTKRIGFARCPALRHNSKHPLGPLKLSAWQNRNSHYLKIVVVWQPV